MNEIKLIDDNWVDILPIPNSHQADTDFIFIMLFSVLLCALTLYVMYRRRPVIQLKHQIKRLEGQLNQINNKTILCRLEKTLCQHYRVANLIFVADNRSTWSRFKEQLTQSCYSSTEPDLTTTQALLHEASMICLSQGNE